MILQQAENNYTVVHKLMHASTHATHRQPRLMVITAVQMSNGFMLEESTFFVTKY